MNKIALARRLAAQSKPVFVECEPTRVTRSTAYENFKRQKLADMERQVTALLEAEQARLIRTWDHG